MPAGPQTDHYGLGSAIYEWGVQPDPIKVGTNPDYAGVVAAIKRLAPAHTRGSLIWRSSALVGGVYQTAAVPDDANCIPDQVIPS